MEQRNVRTWMCACTVVLLAAVLSSPARAQEKWTWSPSGSNPGSYEMSGDPTKDYNDAGSAFIGSKAREVTGFGTWMTMIEPGEFLGKRVRLSAYVKTENVGTWAALWLRIDGEDRAMLNFDNMEDRPIKGWTDWDRYAIVLDVPEESVGMAFGVMLIGSGKVWAGNMQLEEVGEDVAETGGRDISTAPARPAAVLGKLGQLTGSWSGTLRSTFATGGTMEWPFEWKGRYFTDSLGVLIEGDIEFAPTISSAWSHIFVWNPSREAVSYMEIVGAGEVNLAQGNWTEGSPSVLELTGDSRLAGDVMEMHCRISFPEATRMEWDITWRKDGEIRIEQKLVGERK